VVGNQIEDEFKAALVGFFQQAIKIIQCTEHWVDVAVVGYVVAKIVHWRGVDGRNPDGIYAQAFEVIQPLGDAG
jgi:hypothetical protein